MTNHRPPRRHKMSGSQVRLLAELEGLVADDLWPLATYQEMLFIR
jgi:glutamine synthetase type III